MPYHFLAGRTRKSCRDAKPKIRAVRQTISEKKNGCFQFYFIFVAFHQRTQQLTTGTNIHQLEFLARVREPRTSPFFIRVNVPHDCFTFHTRAVPCNPTSRALIFFFQVFGLTGDCILNSLRTMGLIKVRVTLLQQLCSFDIKKRKNRKNIQLFSSGCRQDDRAKLSLPGVSDSG